MSVPSRSALVRALELARDVAAGTSPAEVLDAILDSALELTGGERGFVVVPVPGGTEVRAARHYGRRGVPVGDSRVSDSIVGTALASGETVLVKSAADDPRFATRKSIRELRLRSVIAAPIKAGDETYGAVLVEDRRRLNAFGASERELLELLAAHAALALRGVAERRSLEHELAVARAGTLTGRRFGRLVGTSATFAALVRRLERAASSDATVLIEGESGTGKELVARTLHEHGGRKDGPFVAVNMPDVPETLLESELFGHAKGAFTGANAWYPGLLRESDGGTIFLDEIGELPLPIQAKLLRFLQEKTVRAVGSSRSTRVNARVIAATNRDLGAAVRAGQFREDLYFRLNVLRLEVPPLRARREDIAPLASHFLCAIAMEQETRPRVLSREALRELERHAWPGNVRELENAIRRAVVLGNDPILPEDLALAHREDFGLASLERQAALRALEHAGGSVTNAARVLGIHRATLYRKLRSWGVLNRLRAGLPKAPR
jgi:DNA-binding NtrC family response regulator